jgi:hypothetical protein
MVQIRDKKSKDKFSSEERNCLLENYKKLFLQ